MVGVITTWDILTHPIATIQSFGWGVFFRAVFGSREKTFLSLLNEAAASSRGWSSHLQRCVELELRSKRIYAALASIFADQDQASRFFALLARQEQDHADLLELCQAAAIREKWEKKLFHPWQDYLPRLEQRMKDVEESASKIDSLDAALLLVLEIESSEINSVFRAAVAATDLILMKRLKPFQKALKIHLAAIVDQLTQLAPYLMLACRDLQAKFPRNPP